MPLIATRGAASAQGFGEFAPSGAVPAYIEDVFSTYLYTGTGSTQTITNGIDLSTKGGLVWTKPRNTSSTSNQHNLIDTVRGGSQVLSSDKTAAQFNYTPLGISSFGASGFTVNDNAGNGFINENGMPYASWTFRKQPKFFDVVTYTGNSVARRISHNLGSVPGCIIVKCTNVGGTSWFVYHRSAGGINYFLRLQGTNAVSELTEIWGTSDPTATDFGLSGLYGNNASGETYVAYLFAHNAGGFGLTGNDNVISCGSYTGNGSTTGPIITLGYEPQWLMIKRTSSTGSWYIFDSMRGLRNSGGVWLLANTSDAENTSVNIISSLATGFQPVQTGTATNGNGSEYIYIAIRRGPMKVPTSGTSVFAPVARAGTSATATVTTNFVTDSVWSKVRNNTDGVDGAFYDRLRGVTFLVPNTAGAELSNGGLSNFANNTGYNLNSDGSTFTINSSSYNYGNWAFKRAPGFFDVVCYTGTEVSGQTFNHNLGAVPEMMIVKSRSGTTDWTVYHSALGASARIYLNATNAANTGTAAPWNSTAPTSSVFSLGNAGATNLSGETFVNYLFATVAGVSKVGSYTGTGTTQTINCGFTGGARFVLIKRTDSTGDWYVWDSARGIVAGNDPYLLLNSTAAEVTNTDYVDTFAAGFEISSTAPAAINANGGTFIFLAIA